MVKKYLSKACLILCGLLILEIAFYISGRSYKQDDQYRDATSFAYDDLNTGTTSTAFSLEELKKVTLSAKESPAYLTGFKHQPLFVDFTRHPHLESKYPEMKGKKVLFFSSYHKGLSMVAVDLESSKILWQTPLNKSNPQATGVIDTETGKIYFLSHYMDHDSSLFLKDIPFRHQDQHYQKNFYISSMNLNGSSYNQVRFNLSDILEDSKYHGRKSVSDFVLKCATGVALNKTENGTFITFGCSGGIEYAIFRGVRGVLLKYGLDKEGEILPETLKAFFPSQIQDYPLTGFDTGIYMGGSDPSILPSGKTLIGTSNGPFIPDLNNFSCSVLRLNENFELDGEGAYIGRDQEGFNECYLFNLDFAAGITTVKSGAALLSAAKGKDGVVHVFNPLDMSTAQQLRSAKYDVGDYVFVAPLILTKENKPPRVITNGNNFNLIGLEQDGVILGLEEHEVELLQYNYVKDRCLGYSPQSGNTSKVSLLYSGNFRGNLVNLVEGTALMEAIQDISSGKLGTRFHSRPALYTDKFWSPYRKLHLSFNTIMDGESPHPKLKLAPVEVVFGPDVFNIHVEGFFKSRERIGRVVEEAGFKILVPKDGMDCETIEGYSKIFGFIKPAPNKEERRDFLIALDHKENSLVPAWKVILPEGFQVQRTNMSLLKTSDNEGIVAAPVTYTGDRRIKEPIKVLFINAADGSLVNEVPLRGQMHFSVPLFIGPHFVAGTQSGINVYRLISPPQTWGWEDTISSRIINWFIELIR